MKLIYRGAEADIYEGDWAGLRAIYKFRNPLEYRLAELDAEIRSQRTAREARLLREARRHGVDTPHVYYVSLGEALIVQELVEGERLKVVVEKSDEAAIESIFLDFGARVAMLHKAGIMHGDLTTSNVIVRGNGDARDDAPRILSLIDFGLAVNSARVEDYAIDLRLIKETLVGAHSHVHRKAFGAFLRGYEGTLGETKAPLVTRQLAEIEKRGRYARVE